MRTTVAALAIAALLLSAASAKAQFEVGLFADDPGFNTRECVANATHILVVNSQGSVLEVWKGDTRFGEVIPIHALANLTITQSRVREVWELGGAPPMHLSFRSWWGDTGEQMILFLKKADAPDPTNGLLKGWRPASQNGFEHSYACVDAFGYVRVRPARHSALVGLPDSGLRASEENLKEWVFKLMGQQPDHKK
jgi:hypothetical protein